VIKWLEQLIAQFKILVLSGLLVLVLVAVAEIFHKTRSVVSSVVVLVLGAGLLYAANNIQIIQTKIGNDVTNPGSLRAPARLRPVPVLAVASVDGRVVLYRRAA
jgi:hypothetical protein